MNSISGYRFTSSKSVSTLPGFKSQPAQALEEVFHAGEAASEQVTLSRAKSFGDKSDPVGNYPSQAMDEVFHRGEAPRPSVEKFVDAKSERVGNYPSQAMDEVFHRGESFSAEKFVSTQGGQTVVAAQGSASNPTTLVMMDDICPEPPVRKQAASKPEVGSMDWWNNR